MDIASDLTAGSPTFMDWMLDASGDLVFTSDVDAAGTNPVLQAIMQALLSFRGEWFLNLSDGFPWFQTVLVRNPPPGSIENAFSAAILRTPGVIQLLSLSVNIDRAARKCSVAFSAASTHGAIDWSGALEYASGASR